jgi:thioredoxin-related protein
MRRLPLPLLFACWLVSSACGQDTGPDGQVDGYSLLKNASPLVGWVSFEEGLARADSSGKKVLVDIFSPTCGWCRKMQQEAYTSTDVLDYIDTHFETARLDIDVLDDSLSYKDMKLSSGHLAYGFGATGTPTTVFLTPAGDYITRLPGYAPTTDFLVVLKYIATDAFLNQSFEDFVAAEGGAQSSGQ